MVNRITLSDAVDIANTGLDAIKRAPIVENDTGLKCLRIQDVSQSKSFNDWGFTKVTEENFERFQLKKSDIIVARTGGSVGVNQYISEDMQAVFNNGLIRLRVKTNQYYPEYIYYLLQSDSFKHHINSIAYSTSAQPNMKIRDLLRFSFKEQSFDTQKAIAHILGTLDKKIELNRQINETLEAMAQALFKSWFVDFDPVIDNALLAGKTIPEPLKQRAEMRQAQLESGKAKTNSEINDLFPSEFEFTEELGWIPLGWISKSLSNFVVESNTGADAIQKAPIVDYDTGIKCARVGDFSNNRDIASWGFANVTADNFEKFRLLKGDILITRTSILGLSKIILEDLNAVYNNGLIKIRVNTNPIYVYQAFQSAEFKTYINRITGESSTRPNMKINYLLGYPLLHPSAELLKKASEIFSDSLIKRKDLDLQIETLAKLRDTLLPKLMSGELRIPDAEKLAENI